MKKEENKKSGLSASGIVALGAGVAALSAATYYFLGPKGKANRAEFKGWMIKMKAEIVEKLEDSKEVTEEAYHKVIDTLAQKYAKLSKVDAEELALYTAKLKKGWAHISGTKKKKPAKKKVVTK